MMQIGFFFFVPDGKNMCTVLMAGSLGVVWSGLWLHSSFLSAAGGKLSSPSSGRVSTLSDKALQSKSTHFPVELAN